MPSQGSNIVIMVFPLNSKLTHVKQVSSLCLSIVLWIVNKDEEKIEINEPCHIFANFF